MKISEIRQVDYKGRVIIPKLYLDAAGIDTSSPIIISYLTESKSIVITKLEDPDLIKASTQKDSNI